MKSAGVCVCLTLSMVMGCGGGSGSKLKLVPAAGVVRFKEQPVADALITFYPESGPAGVARTDASGKFQIKTNGQLGAVAGKHRVTVSSAQQDVGDDLPADGHEMEREAQRKKVFSVKYSDQNTTDLIIDLPADGDKNLVLDLTE